MTTTDAIAIPATNPRPPARCGTLSGFRRHQRLNEKPCDACTHAKQVYDQRWRSAPERTRKNRLHARAQGAAKTLLRQLYPDAYRALYRQELARLTAEAEQDQS
jgi:hypothetical protein